MSLKYLYMDMDMLYSCTHFTAVVHFSLVDDHDLPSLTSG
jgi:hypothetical protein